MRMVDVEKDSLKKQHMKKETKRRKMKMLMGEGAGGDDDSSTNSFNLDFEKQLRKLATKGGKNLMFYFLYNRLILHSCAWILTVVALFNAVAKAKKEKMLEQKGNGGSKAANIDDDNHSLGSLRDMPSVHKRPASAALPSSKSDDSNKKMKTQWSVLDDMAASKPAVLKAGWDQEDDED
ncbi:hypothetical protein EON65_05760 [archaeon]|nr:MAG: hypothetical protein EON65_05760 [archaeon]